MTKVNRSTCGINTQLDTHWSLKFSKRCSGFQQDCQNQPDVEKISLTPRRSQVKEVENELVPAKRDGCRWEKPLPSLFLGFAS